MQEPTDAKIHIVGLYSHTLYSILAICDGEEESDE